MRRYLRVEDELEPEIPFTEERSGEMVDEEG
jgi:hypothetical protein